MIRQDSPLRRLPVALDPTQAMFFDGLRFCVEVVEDSMSSLRMVLADITTKEEQSALYPRAMMLAWSVVDSVNRTRVLLEAMKRAGWVKQTDKFRALMRSLEAALPLRDSAQHLDERIQQAPDPGVPPVWGSLAWFMVTEFNDTGTPARGESCLLVPGSVFKREGLALVNPAGRTFRSPIDGIELEAFGAKVLLGSLEKSMEEVIRPVEEAILNQIPPESSTRAADVLLVVTMEFS